MWSVGTELGRTHRNLWCFLPSSVRSLTKRYSQILRVSTQRPAFVESRILLTLGRGHLPISCLNQLFIWLPGGAQPSVRCWLPAPLCFVPCEPHSLSPYLILGDVSPAPKAVAGHFCGSRSNSTEVGSFEDGASLYQERFSSWGRGGWSGKVCHPDLSAGLPGYRRARVGGVQG